MTGRLGLKLGAGAALAAALVGAAGLWAGARRDAAEEEARLRVAKVDEPAPELVLADLAGRRVRLQDFRGRVVLVNFWATWCPPCREEMPAIEALARELGPRGLTVLGVNVREGDLLVASFVREYGLTFPVLLDAEGEITARFRVVGLPATFLVDRRGVVVGKVIGLRDWGGPEARAYLERLLATRA